MVFNGFNSLLFLQTFLMIWSGYILYFSSPHLEYHNILSIYYGDFFGFISLVVLLRRQFCGGVGRVGKIV